MDGTYEITDLNVTGAGKILKMKVNGKQVDVVTDITKNADDEITAISINGTSQEIAGGGSSDIEENKEATIDVAAYTVPVEIEPTEGKDGMAKCTVTLTNIPSGGGTAYAWKHSGTTIQYFDFAVAPADLAGMSASKSLELGAGGAITVFPEEGEVDAYTRTSDTEFTVSFGATELTFVRDATKDFILW